MRYGGLGGRWGVGEIFLGVEIMEGKRKQKGRKGKGVGETFFFFVGGGVYLGSGGHWSGVKRCFRMRKK